jgi:hypothetical protein
LVNCAGKGFLKLTFICDVILSKKPKNSQISFRDCIKMCIFRYFCNFFVAISLTWNGFNTTLNRFSTHPFTHYFFNLAYLWNCDFFLLWCTKLRSKFCICLCEVQFCPTFFWLVKYFTFSQFHKFCEFLKMFFFKAHSVFHHNLNNFQTSPNTLSITLLSININITIITIIIMITLITLKNDNHDSHNPYINHWNLS